MEELNKQKNKLKGWFKMGNIFVDKYARAIGPIGTAVYLCLKRHANNETRIAFPSYRLISEELNISQRTVLRHISILKKYGFIIITKTKNKGKWLNNSYYLTYSKDWKIKPSDLKSPSPYD